jgi:hypothetical protein
MNEPYASFGPALSRSDIRPPRRASARASAASTALLARLGTGLVALTLAAFLATQAFAQTYNQWQPPTTAQDPELSALLDDLETLVDDAEQSRAADPEFLNDLNDLLATYGNPWGTRLLYDDFKDGNYTSNPRWTVASGNFKVNDGQNPGLRSKVGRQGDNAAQAIIGALLGQSNINGAAAIYTPVKISNAFRVEMNFMSSSNFGRWDIGTYQGSPTGVSYRLAYFPNSSPGLQLLRVTSQGAAVIASYNSSLMLEDNRQHTLVWTRDRNGQMYIAIDGKQLIAVKDTSFRDPFDGFAMINSGGTFTVQSIAINGRPAGSAS